MGGGYKVFGEDEKPFIYLQARIPGRLWGSRDMLFEIMTLNPKNRWLVNTLEDGQRPHFRISSGLTKKKENKAGFFEITCEIDENLFPVIAKNRGSFELGMSTTKFYGSGMVKASKEILGQEYDAQHVITE